MDVLFKSMTINGICQTENDEDDLFSMKNIRNVTIQWMSCSVK